MSRLRIMALVAALALLLAAPLWGPPVLRRMPGFEVERVVLFGAELLAPREVLAASGIHQGQNIWEDEDRWVAALRDHPVIADARISRRPPGTLHIRLVEERPVAFVQDGTLRLATATGAILPVDPSRVPVDLPLIRTGSRAVESDRIEDPEVRLLLAEVGRLQRLGPDLAGRISEAGTNEAGQVVLTLARPAVELVVPPGAGAARLRQLEAVLADLERQSRSRISEGEPPLPERVDLRFEEQIVVRYSSN